MYKCILVYVVIHGKICFHQVVILEKQWKIMFLDSCRSIHWGLFRYQECRS